MSVTLAGSLSGEGYDGDPVQQRIVNINALITTLNAALTSIVNSFGRGVALWLTEPRPKW